MWARDKRSCVALPVLRLRVRHSAALGHRVALAGSVVVIAAGAYWFVQRVFFPVI